MSVTCKELVQAAENFNNIATCEAEWRGVCNRCYYGVYPDAKAFAKTLADAGYPGNVVAGSKGGRHIDLCERLANPDAPKSDPRRNQSRNIGMIMLNLLAKRTKSDYYPEQDIDQISAVNGVVNAKNVLLLLSGQSIGVQVPKFPGTLTAPPSNTPTAQPPTGIPQPANRGHLKPVK